MNKEVKKRHYLTRAQRAFPSSHTFFFFGHFIYCLHPIFLLYTFAIHITPYID